MQLVERQIYGIRVLVDIESSNIVYVEKKDAVNLKSKRLDSLLEYISKSVPTFIPLVATIEITNACNFNCEFCYIHSKNSSSFLSFSQIRSTIDYLSNKGLLYCVITGGECMFHREFIDIYTYIKSKGILVTVFTNGSLINHDILSLFSQYKPYRVEVSLYSTTNDQFALITRQNKVNCSTVLNNIIQLKNNGINVICKTPRNTVTDGVFPDILKWCQNNGIKHCHSTVVLDSYSAKPLQRYSLGFFEHTPLPTSAPNEDIPILPCIAKKMYLYYSYNNSFRPCFDFFDIDCSNFSLTEKGVDGAYTGLLKYLHDNTKKCCGSNADSITHCSVSECLYLRIKGKTHI